MTKEKEKAYKRKYYEKNKEKVKAKAKKYAQEHPEKKLNSNRKYRQKHPEKVKAWQEKFNKKHPEKRKIYYEKNKGHYRKRIMKSKYNLSHEDWSKMWENQDKKCLICEKPFIEPSNACIDHNHETGEIRGLLCKNCNFIIGLLHDDPKWAIRIAKYLKGDKT